MNERSVQYKPLSSTGGIVVDFSERVDSEVRVVKLDEAQILDEHFAQKIGAKLNEIVNNMDESAFLLNMSNVKFMASAMIGQLVVLRENCRKKDVQLAVCGLNENLCEAIKLMRIDQILEVHEREESALTSLASGS